MAIVRTQVELSGALRRGQRLEAENRLLRTEGRPALIAESASMQPVLQLISRVGPSDANVLITGEPGDLEQGSGGSDAACGLSAKLAADGNRKRRRFWLRGFSRVSCSAT